MSAALKTFGQRLRAPTSRTSAATLTFRQSLLPLCLVTLLFFLWGFSYGLLDTLNKHFQETLGITRARSAGLQAAYFGAYPLAALGHANWIMRHYGYKAVFIWGLVFYGIGALIAWPSLLHRSFAGFCAAIFVIGNGLGSLETAASPYISICGPPKQSELRINFSQAFNGIGSVLAPLIGSYAFFNVNPDNPSSIQNVQWTYLAIACFVFLLAIVFFFTPIPEITDADMQFQVEHSNFRESSDESKPFLHQYKLFHAAASQFAYCGAQVAIAGYLINYIVESRAGTSTATGAQFLAGAQGVFAAGRFIGSFMMRYIRPRRVFLTYSAAVIVFIIPAIATYGNSGLAMMFLVFFFESIIFPTIIALGIRGLGRHTKRGSGVIVAAVAGGAVVPVLLGTVADSLNSTRYAMVVPLAFYMVPFSYAICLNCVQSYRQNCDQFDDDAVVGVENVEVIPEKPKTSLDITEEKTKGNTHVEAC